MKRKEQASLNRLGKEIDPMMVRRHDNGVFSQIL
jgi:hypothetical protein